MKLLENIFSVKNKEFHKVWTILGLKLKCKNKSKVVEANLDRIIFQIQQEHQSQAQKIDTVVFQIQQECQSQVQKIDSLLNQTKFLMDNIFVMNELYNSNTERIVLEKFYDYFENELSLDKHNALTSNLLPEDVNTIDKIINRQNRIRNTYGQFIDIFTPEEKVQIKLVREELSNKVVKICDDIYKWEKYYLPINWFEPCVFYYKHSLDSLLNLEKLKDKDIIDAGGFIGDSALILSSLTNQKVYSFEPTPNSCELFKKTIELNNLNNVVLEQYALGDANKEVELNINTSSSSINDFRHADILDKITVQMITLDEYVDKNNLKIGLIKTDLEGAERFFINGAEKTIKEQKPALLISIYHNPQDFYEIKPLLESWDLGYKFRVIKGTDSSISLETILVCEVID